MKAKFTQGRARQRKGADLMILLGCGVVAYASVCLGAMVIKKLGKYGPGVRGKKVCEPGPNVCA